MQQLEARREARRRLPGVLRDPELRPESDVSPEGSGTAEADPAQLLHLDDTQSAVPRFGFSSSSPLFLVLALWWTHMMGSFLEREWGGVRYLAYWFVGILGTAVLALGLRVPATNEYLLLSLLLAVATLDPDRQMMLLVIPMQLK